MRSLTFAISIASAVLAPTAVMAATLTPVNLTAPLNWLAGDYLFPSQIIAGYHANLSEYDAESWGDHVLSACKGFSACTSVNVFQATNSGNTGGRFWFGYVFRGGPTDESFYERDEDVTDSAAWSV